MYYWKACALMGRVAVVTDGVGDGVGALSQGHASAAAAVPGDRLSDAARARMEVLIAEGCRVVSRRRFARAMRLFDGESLLRVVARDVPSGASGGGRGVAPDRAWRMAGGGEQPELPFE